MDPAWDAELARLRAGEYGGYLLVFSEQRHARLVRVARILDKGEGALLGAGERLPTVAAVLQMSDARFEEMYVHPR